MSLLLGESLPRLDWMYLAIAVFATSICLTLVLPGTAFAATNSCGDTRANYRENGTTQYVQASNIRATNIGCTKARSITRSWLKDSRLSGDPSDGVRGYDCTYTRYGSDIGRTTCRKGSRRIKFDAYDSSPYH